MFYCRKDIFDALCRILAKLVLSRKAPLFEGVNKLGNSLFGISALGRKRLLVFLQKITAMLDDIVHRQIDKTQIRRLIRLHQVCAQMVDGREPVVVIGFSKALCKNRVAFDSSRLVKAHKEVWIDFTHFILKKILKQVEAPTTALITTALSSMEASLGCRHRAIKETAAPRWLLFEMQEIALFINRAPTNRASPHVETNAIFAGVIP